MKEAIFLCLGSNYSDAEQKLAAAAACILRLQDISYIGTSRIFLTEPQDYTAQPWFYNQAMGIHAPGWSPARLMAALLGIEKKMGRERNADAVRFGPRPIDIDILLYGDRISNDPFCMLPHPRLCQRAFALVPLLEIKPDATINGVAAVKCLERLDWSRKGNIIYQRNQDRCTYD